MLYSSRDRLGHATESPVGHVPVLGEGLHMSMARQCPGMVHSLQHLVGEGTTHRENWGSGTQGHDLPLRNNDLPQKFPFPEVDNSRLDKFLNDKRGGGIIEEFIGWGRRYLREILWSS